MCVLYYEMEELLERRVTSLFSLPVRSAQSQTRTIKGIPGFRGHFFSNPFIFVVFYFFLNIALVILFGAHYSNSW